MGVEAEEGSGVAGARHQKMFPILFLLIDWKLAGTLRTEHTFHSGNWLSLYLHTRVLFKQRSGPPQFWAEVAALHGVRALARCPRKMQLSIWLMTFRRPSPGAVPRTDVRFDDDESRCLDRWQLCMCHYHRIRVTART